MKLRELEILQLPGAGSLHIQALAPGANLVTGPNASGKSSLVRALRFLIGGAQRDDPPALSLKASLEDADGHWQVRRAGSQVVWQRDGKPVDAPPLPAAGFLHCYWLRVEDLLSPRTEDDHALIEKLRRELSGGFDLEGVRHTFDFGPRTGQTESRRLLTARRRRRDVENRYQALQGEQAQLPELQRAADNSRHAADRAQQLHTALGLLEARRARLDLEAQLERYPPSMEQLRGDELERLDELEAEYQARCADRAEQARRRDDAADRLEETRLATAWPEAAELRARQDSLMEMDRLTTRLASEREQLAKALAREHEAALELGDGETQPRLDPDSVSRAEALAIEMYQARCEHAEQQAKLDAIDVDTPMVRSPSYRLWAGGLAFVGGLLATVATTLSGAWGGLAGAISAVGAGVWIIIAASREAWTAHSRTEAIIRTRRRQALEEKLRGIDAHIDQHLQTQRRICQQCGLDPGHLTGAGLYRFLHRAEALNRARVERREIEQHTAQIESEHTDQANRLRAFLSHWQADAPTDDHAGLRRALEMLEMRQQAAVQAMGESRQAVREIARLDQALETLNSRIHDLYGRAGLEAADRSALARCCEDHGQWHQIHRDLEKARHIEAERQRPLTGDVEILQRVEAGEEAALQAELNEQQRQGSQLEALRNRISQLHSRLDQAGRNGELEQATAEENTAGDALADMFDQAMVAEAGQYLVDDITATYQTEHEPEILRDARARFARFTHHAWTLEMTPEAGFCARQQATGERRGLIALSSGTRMQLLLAVRLAWARRIEHEKKPLPLFLDEALTTSDEARFSQVADSLQQLVQDEGRQIFYLSARRQEIELWAHATGKRPHVVDIGESRLAAIGPSSETYALADTQRLPSPTGHSPESYACELTVPPVEPWRPAGSIPIFHLLRDDLPLLHHLLEDWRIAHLGDLEALLAGLAAAQAVPERSRRETLAGHCRTARAWVMIWTQGRGKPVDRGALEASGCISETFIDRVSELAERVHGDAKALIEALRNGQVARFRNTNIQELADWLQGNRYLDTNEPLSPEARERQTLQAAADQPPQTVRRVVGWLEAGQG